MTQISVPEERVDAVYDADVAQMLQSRYLTPTGWVQGVNRLQYQAYWIRDSAVETVALDQIGLHSGRRRRTWPSWPTGSSPDGLYISRAGQQDGVGQALWELAEHARLTAESALSPAAQLASVTAAVGWIDQRERLRTVWGCSRRARSPMTSSSPAAADHRRQRVGGGRAALRRAAGQAGAAPALAAETGGRSTIRFEAGAAPCSAPGRSRGSGTSPPGWTRPGRQRLGQLRGRLPRSRSSHLRGPDGPARRCAWATRPRARGAGTMAESCTITWSSPSTRPSWRPAMSADALRGFYAELVHTTASGYGWEDGPEPYGERDSTTNLTPHGTFAGQFVRLLRNLLVRDEGDGVALLAASSPAWLRPGDTSRCAAPRSPARTSRCGVSVTPLGRCDDPALADPAPDRPVAAVDAALLGARAQTAGRMAGHRQGAACTGGRAR